MREPPRDAPALTPERKFRDDEIREILDSALMSQELDRPHGSAGDGLTLSDLKEVGREVGIDPARIAHAVNSLEARPNPVPQQRSLGMPISVGRVVDLPRTMSDREWSALVAEIRDTFGARGRVASDGVSREWRNGNLHAVVEPSATGYRFRIGTRKGSAKAQNRLGALGIGIGWILAAVALLPGDPAFLEVLPPSVILTSMGGAALLINAVGLPRWVREREHQMDYIVARVGEITRGSERHESGAP